MGLLGEAIKDFKGKFKKKGGNMPKKNKQQEKIEKLEAELRKARGESESIEVPKPPISNVPYDVVDTLIDKMQKLEEKVDVNTQRINVHDIVRWGEIKT